MEILANDSDWTPTDELALAAFLGTSTGRRFIPSLVSASPGLLTGGEINAILIRTGEVRAFQTVIEAILIMAHPPASLREPGNAYPALEDDNAWADGQRLDVPKPETPSNP
jgi:hypothetical protein